MPNMEVFRVEDIDLDVTVFEAKETSKEINFNIQSEPLPKTHVS